jgi:hypothetical protein
MTSWVGSREPHTKKLKSSQVLVAHACNSTYSGGSWFKASLGQQFKRPYVENTQHKRGLADWLKV